MNLEPVKVEADLGYNMANYKKKEELSPDTMSTIELGAAADYGINKTASVWRSFDDSVLGFRPHPKSTAVGDIFKHELLSGRRFFADDEHFLELDIESAEAPARLSTALGIEIVGWADHKAMTYEDELAELPPGKYRDIRKG